MRKLFVGLLAVMVLLVAVASPAMALDHREAARVTVAKDEVVNDDMFLTGGTVWIDGTVNGDVFAFADEVLVNGTINGNLITGANTVEVRGVVTGTVLGAGNRIYVSGRVDRSLVTAGSDIYIDGAATVGHTWLGAGDRLALKGNVGRAVHVAGAHLTANGHISRELEAYVGDLRIDANAVVEGPVTYYSNRQASIDSGARTGPVTYHEVEYGSVNVPRMWTGWSFLWRAFRFAGFLLVSLGLLALFPSLRNRFPDLLKRHPWQAPLAGFLSLLLVPIAVVVLLLTVVGIPLSLLTMLLFPVLIYGGQILVSWTVGRLLGDTVEQLRNLSWPVLFLIGALLTSVVVAVPGFGWLFGLTALVYGLGGIYYLMTQRA